MSNHKAPFITFEGGEGSGKSTQINILYRKLLQAEVDVVSYREPGGTIGAEEIRALLMEGESVRWTAKAEALLMSAARADLVQKRIVPELEGGSWVLCDRFTDSTVAYQGYGHQLGYEPMLALNKFTVGILEPDLTFIFQISPALGLERVEQRNISKTRFDCFDLEFHHRVDEGYKEILKNNPERCVAINALLDIDKVEQLIFEEVRLRFGI
ncbi:MAG: dTMP kinase [Alphaproteobacteria bacterium]|nr:dTMP kinase [Alphaproteobacteria bacterium]MBP7729499.1 dTMP kinase [Alphaproteobacteria bacterium]